ncbi:MAG: tRNA pseudouridine(38-40) synthase TruA [Spirosomataceae bacterium]
MRYFIEISYLGTHFSGFQIQPNARTVQGELEKALSLVLRYSIAIQGSSRTDAGVHAKQQYAHFDFEPIPNPEDLVYKLNRFLPSDLAVLALYALPEVAHARFDAIHRKYEYHISTVKSPFLTGKSWLNSRPVDLEKMNEAAQLLIGYHDFEAFTKVKTEVNNFFCTITEAQFLFNESGYVFHVKANRFLRGMVRALVGTLVDVGYGKIELSDFQDIINSKNRQRAGSTAPAEGLYLTEVGYPPDYFRGN